MKKLLCLLSLAALPAFSQSYIVLNNGITLTLDRDAFVYDLSQFNQPYKITNKGASYFFEDNILHTFNKKGFIFTTDFKEDDILEKGGNFFFIDNDEIVVIDENGSFFKYEDKVFKEKIQIGGNFLTVMKDKKKNLADLYVINNKGRYVLNNIPELNPIEISVVGGRYFQTQSGDLFSVSESGFVFKKANLKNLKITKKGYNYFMTSDNVIYTVSSDGVVIAPLLPMEFKADQIKKIGANYLIDAQHRIFGVDSKGAVLLRSIKGHDLSKALIISQ